MCATPNVDVKTATTARQYNITETSAAGQYQSVKYVLCLS